MEMESPILVRIYKEESELEVWKQDREGKFALLKTYPICRWSGELGPKFKEGDRQTPEGFYNITPGQMNPNSAYYLSFDLGYPNAYDRSWGRTGAQLMVHGDCSSRGCYSMTDEQIAEIYALGRDAFFGGQKSFQVQAFPFHMTAQNMARHRNNPNIAFWKMIKKGSDHFEVSGLEPKVNVCEKHYVFDAESTNGKPLTFSASGKCPAYRVSEDIASLVKEKEQKDDQQFAELTRRNVRDRAGQDLRRRRHERGVHGGGAEEPDRRRAAGSHTVRLHAARYDPDPRPAAGGRRAGRRPDGRWHGKAHPARLGRGFAAGHGDRRRPNRSRGSNGGGLFGSLFASKSADPAPAAEKSEGTFDRMKRLVGLRGADKDKAADAASKAQARRQADPGGLPWRDPAEAHRSRAREVRRSARSGDDDGLRSDGMAGTRACGSRCCPAEARQRCDDRRGPRGSHRQLRQPLVGVPLKPIAALRHSGRRAAASRNP